VNARIIFAATGIAAGLTLALAGCGRRVPEGLVAVNGVVTFQSRPVPYGEVVFEPDPTKGNRGPQCRCAINNGAYATRADFGAPRGPVIVMVTGFTQPPGFDYLEARPLFTAHSFTADLSAAPPRLDIVVPAE
jgi:hypothetical protein